MSILNSILGGGNIFGALLNVASLAFPALQLASSLFNALGSAVGGAIKEALSQLSSESGLPKFLANAIKSAVDEIIGGNQQATDPGADVAVQGQFGEQMKTFMENLVKQIVQDTKDAKAEEDGKGTGSGGWLVALAKAFGKLADKAAKELEMAGKNLTNENPSEMIEYQAKSQEFSQMMNTFTNAIKTIGESQANAVRKG